MGGMSDHFNKTSVGSGGMGLLKRAVEKGDIETIKLLLGHGADVNQRDGGKGKSSTGTKPKPDTGILPSAAAPSGQPQDIKVLAPAKVRKRTPKEKEISLLKHAQVHRRKGGGGKFGL
jgi:hypothetical protein